MGVGVGVGKGKVVRVQVGVTLRIGGRDVIAQVEHAQVQHA